MLHMSPHAADTEAFIEHLLQRYHQVHRAELPALVQQAQALQAAGLTPALAQAFAELEQALELHMFKEEARMFPMMLQGGNTLLHHLVADMAAEHRQHEERVQDLQSLLQQSKVADLPGARQALARLLDGAAKLLADLHEHVRLEDELLFPRYAKAPR